MSGNSCFYHFYEAVALVTNCPQDFVGNGIGPTGCVSQWPITVAWGSAPCQNGAARQLVFIFPTFMKQLLYM